MQHCGEPGLSSLEPFVGSGVWFLLQTEQALPLQPQIKCFTPQPSQCSTCSRWRIPLLCLKGQDQTRLSREEWLLLCIPWPYSSSDTQGCCWGMWLARVELVLSPAGSSQPSAVARGCRTLLFSLLSFIRFLPALFSSLGGSPALGHADWSPGLVLSIYKILPCISSRAISAVLIIVEIKQHYLDSVFWQYEFLFIS